MLIFFSSLALGFFMGEKFQVILLVVPKFGEIFRLSCRLVRVPSSTVPLFLDFLIHILQNLNLTTF